MSAPTLLRMAFDSGWSHGDPGDGRLRFDNPRIAKAGHLCINARDAQEAMLDELVPTWRIGDVIVVERPGVERNRVVVWIIGPISHMGSFYRVPIIVRTVHGAFAAHDELALHHHRNVTETDTAEPHVASPSSAPLAPPQAVQALTPIAPIAALAPPSGQPVLPVDMSLLPVASASINPVGANSAGATASDTTAELANLRADNAALHDILAGLLTDTTELYAVEGTS